MAGRRSIGFFELWTAVARPSLEEIIKTTSGEDLNTEKIHRDSRPIVGIFENTEKIHRHSRPIVGIFENTEKIHRD